MSVEKLWDEGDARLDVVRLWLKLGSSTSCSSRSETHYSEGTDARDDTRCQDQRFGRIWPGGSVESRPGGSVESGGRSGAVHFYSSIVLFIRITRFVYIEILVFILVVCLGSVLAVS